MVNGNQPQAQQPAPEKPKFTIFDFRAWPEIFRNIWIKLPGIRRMGWGRRQVGERPIPIEYELREVWIKRNDEIFNTPLTTVETFWKLQGEFLGAGKKDSADESLRGNPAGIVKLYEQLDHYSDIDSKDKGRIDLERIWFEHGTGFIEENIVYKIPDDQKEWLKYGWIHTEAVERIRRNPRLLQGLDVLFKRIKLEPGIVYHEGKKELEETLYCFGFHKAKEMVKLILQYEQLLNLEGLQQKGVEVEVRTKFSTAVKAINNLFDDIVKLEESTFKYLSGLSGVREQWYKKWDEQKTTLSTEAKQGDIGIIRFPHTFRIIKPYTTEEIIEEIEIKGRVVKDSADNKKAKVKGTYPNKRIVLAELDPENHKKDTNVYAEENKKLGASRTELERLNQEELSGISEKVKSVNKVRDVKDFNELMKRVVNKNGTELVNVIGSNVSVEVKIGRINELLIHEEGVINKTLSEILKDIEPQLRTILEEPDVSANRKLENIISAFATSLKASFIIETLFIKNRSALVASFNPRREDNTIKTNRDIYNELLQALLTSYYIIDEIIVKIFNENDIMGLIEAGETTDEKLELLKNIVVTNSKQLDKENARIVVKLAELQSEENSIKDRYNSMISGVIDRLTDIENITNKTGILEQLRPKISPDDFWKRPEEVAYGLDESGWPLEIDTDGAITGKAGAILIDFWWDQIGKNLWQLKTIAAKPGGAEVLKKHLDVDVEFNCPRGKSPSHDEIGIRGTPKRDIRYLKDQRFWGHVDLLDVGSIIFSQWDAYRDDLRDGRYHPHSKSVGDYVIEGMGNFDDYKGAPFWKGWGPVRKWGWFFTRRGIRPSGPTGIDMNVKDKMITATPADFESVPEEEKKVNRLYRMRMPDGTWYPPEKNGEIVRAERRPTKFNPSFDRRAEKLGYIHWGRMYYYEWAPGINRWSENPFPHVSTRGIALYIEWLTKTDVYYYPEAEKALEGHPFDYGTRGMGKFGKVNPASGVNIEEQEN